MTWDGSLYIDTALPFGLRSAPKIFTAVADAAEWIVRRRGVKFLIHYLDDYLIIGAPHSNECKESLEILLSTFGRLEIPVADDKLEGPEVLIGFEVDSQNMVIRLPLAKLTEMQQLIQDWQKKKSATKKELKSLVGKLAFASQVVKPGKTFLRRMFELISVARHGHHHIRLNVEFRSDLHWWATFLRSWNSVSIIKQYRCFGVCFLSEPTLALSSGQCMCRVKRMS